VTSFLFHDHILENRRLTRLQWHNGVPCQVPKEDEADEDDEDSEDDDDDDDDVYTQNEEDDMY
jgi:hypothetical protein